MPAKKINTRKNYKRGGYNSKKMRGGAEEVPGGASKEQLEKEVIELCIKWAKYVKENNPLLGQIHNFFKTKLENIDKLSPEHPLRQLIEYLLLIEDKTKNKIVTETEITDKITAIKGRLGKGPPQTYKVQMFGELLQLQGQFFPGGFAQGLRGNIKKHMPWITGGLMAEYERLAELGKFVFSNEALDDRFLSSELSELYKLQQNGEKKEFNSVFPSSNGLQEITIDTETYSFIEVPAAEGEGEGEGAPTRYYTAHYSSLAEREAASNEWCNHLSTLLDNLNSKDGKFGGFAGDINLYVTTDTRGGDFELRDGVQTALNSKKCTLTVPYHLLDKGTFRNKVHDQWHKVAVENKPAAEGTPEEEAEAARQPAAGQPGQLDSLIIIEPYVKGFDYQTLANCCHQVFFLPDGILPDGGNLIMPMKGNIEQVTKKPFHWPDRTVTDHFLVEGVNIAIHSGADIHGKGNKAKSLTLLDEMFTYEEGLTHLIKVIKLLNEVAENGSKDVEVSPHGEAGVTAEGDVAVGHGPGEASRQPGGARRVKKSRKKRGRRGKKSKRGSRRN